MLGRRLRDVANVLNGSTPLGLLAGLLGRGRCRLVDGLIVVDHVRAPRFLTASAVTVGGVVLVLRRSLEDAQSRIPRLLEHEDEHVWQWAYCLGLPFVPLYAASTVWSLARTGHRALGNVFEVQAGLESGGYRR